MKDQPLISTNDVYKVVLDALTRQIGSVLDGYSSPLNKIIADVVDGHTPELRGIVERALELTLKDKKFVATVNEEFQHKIAKSLVGKLEGTVERAADKLRQDATLRARMILAIEKIINE